MAVGTNISAYVDFIFAVDALHGFISLLVICGWEQVMLGLACPCNLGSLAFFVLAWLWMRFGWKLTKPPPLLCDLSPKFFKGGVQFLRLVLQVEQAEAGKA